jgi:hypothetical protein
MTVVPLKGHSHENDYEIITLNDRLGPNYCTPTPLRFLKSPIALIRFFLKRGLPIVKWDQLVGQNSQHGAVLVFVQHHAATFLPPNQLTDKILLHHAISRHNSSSVTLIYARWVFIITKAMHSFADTCCTLRRVTEDEYGCTAATGIRILQV